MVNYCKRKWGTAMKKTLSLMSLLLGIMHLSTCSSGSGENVLIDMDSAAGGSWMGYEREAVENHEMITSDTIDYNPSKTYEINRSSYVSYFKGEEFIETIQYSDDPPMTLDTVEEADNIVVSFNVYNEDTIKL